jgi:hypothetical protein
MIRERSTTIYCSRLRILRVFPKIAFRKYRNFVNQPVRPLVCVGEFALDNPWLGFVDKPNDAYWQRRHWSFLFPVPYSLFPAFPSRATLNCAPANRISPEIYAQKSSPTET